MSPYQKCYAHDLNFPITILSFLVRAKHSLLQHQLAGHLGLSTQRWSGSCDTDIRIPATKRIQRD